MKWGRKMKNMQCDEFYACKWSFLLFFERDFFMLWMNFEEESTQNLLLCESYIYSMKNLCIFTFGIPLQRWCNACIGKKWCYACGCNACMLRKWRYACGCNACMSRKWSYACGCNAYMLWKNDVM